MPSITSPAFTRLVSALKQHKATCSVIESCCGGVINSSILAQPGASQVYWGGSVAYNTKRAKPFLLNNEELHQKLVKPFLDDAESEKDAYVQTKLNWTKQTALAFCQETGTDFCIAEGGAAGPTFRPAGLTTGFAVIAVAARTKDGAVELVHQEIIESATNDRQGNMRLFADKAAKLALQAVEEVRGPVELEEVKEEGLNVPILDRATHLRTDSDALASLAPKALYIVLHKHTALFAPKKGTSHSHDRRLTFLSRKEIDAVCGATGANQETTFLGLLDGTRAVFGVDMLLDTEDSIPTLLQAVNDALDGDAATLEDTRTVAPLLSPSTADNELVLHATALAQWQRRAPFCPACGGATTLLDGGTSRKCTSCGQQSWPRQDPSMIAVVSSRDGERVLLGQSPRHPELMFTALAGFVEAGETMERAVAREVYEETGIRIDLDSVEYVATQPWPFPQSTMIGFTATADETQPLNIDTDELVAAAWFDRSQVQAATTVAGPVMQKDVAGAAIKANPKLELLIPPKGVLARVLLETWLEK